MSEHADLSIGDVSKITGLPTHTIRYWEKEFAEFLAPERTLGHQRRYDEIDIQNIEEIRHLLKVEGFSIAGAKRQLSLNIINRKMETEKEEHSKQEEKEILQEIFSGVI